MGSIADISTPLDDTDKRHIRAGIAFAENMPNADRLVEALNRYGKHEDSCRSVSWVNDGPCTCGFDAALTKAGES